MIGEKSTIYYKSFKELWEIIQFFPKDDYNKIPEVFINFIKENMDENYEYIVNHIDDFQNQEMLDETKVLLAIVYRDFLASEEEKEQIIKSEKDKLIQEDKIKQEKFDVDTIFAIKNDDEIKIQNEVLTKKSLIVVKEKWYKKVLDKIRKLFGL